MDRMRCQECNRLIRIGGRKCSNCGSTDIDLAVETFTQLNYLPRRSKLRYREHREKNGPVRIIQA